MTCFCCDGVLVFDRVGSARKAQQVCAPELWSDAFQRRFQDHGDCGCWESFQEQVSPAQLIEGGRVEFREER